MQPAEAEIDYAKLTLLEHMEQMAIEAARDALFNGYNWCEVRLGRMRVNFCKGRRAEPSKARGFMYFVNNVQISRDEAVLASA